MCVGGTLLGAAQASMLVGVVQGNGLYQPCVVVWGDDRILSCVCEHLLP